LNQPDALTGPLRSRDGEPAFNEPWQAQALAMANVLIRSGTVSGSQWAEALAGKLRKSESSGERDDTEAYFAAALSALERMLIDGNNVSKAELDRRRHEWEHAYLDTPHGQPVFLPGTPPGSRL
jgi:nitrile hydratase accessory protein